MNINGFATVQRMWPESTVVCLATGPSLCEADVEYVRGKARVIAINDAYKLAPWADVLYACDEKWWGWHKGVPDFSGLKFSCSKNGRLNKYPGVQTLCTTGRHGLDRHPSHLRDGHNSGYQAINLAIHLGAKRIVLLGYDMSNGGGHFFGKHPDGSGPVVSLCLTAFDSLPRELAQLGVEVVNCSRKTAITSFKQMSLQEVLG